MVDMSGNRLQRLIGEGATQKLLRTGFAQVKKKHLPQLLDTGWWIVVTYIPMKTSIFGLWKSYYPNYYITSSVPALFDRLIAELPELLTQEGKAILEESNMAEVAERARAVIVAEQDRQNMFFVKFPKHELTLSVFTKNSPDFSVLHGEDLRLQYSL
jgi:hypothetical protein